MYKTTPSKKAIVSAWMNGPGLPGKCRFDLGEYPPTETCWACGDGKDDGCKIQRAHIIPKSSGGTLHPLNFLMLCSHCHREQPDSASRASQLLWLERRESNTIRSARLIMDALRALGVDPGRDAADVVALVAESSAAGSLMNMMDPGTGGAHHRATVVASMAWRFAENIVAKLEERRANGRPESGSQMALTFFAPPK